MSSKVQPTSVADGLWFTAPGQAEIRATEVGSPNEGEILVATRYSLVSPGTEMRFYRGEVDAETRRRMAARGLSSGEGPFPLQFGYQAVGVVEDSRSRRFEDGDQVFVKGPHQQRFTAPSTRAWPLEPGLDPRAAVFSNLASVALNALLDSPVRLGDCVVVHGLGVIGTLIGHMARRTAGRLVLVDPLPDRRQRARTVQADAVVAPEEALQAVASLSSGRLADVSFEASGAAAALQAALATTGDEGTVSVPAYYGTQPVPLALAPEFHLRRLRIVSNQVSTVGSGLQPRWDVGRQMEEAMRFLRTIDVEALISHEVPLSQAPEAYAMIDLRPAESLGVLITYA